MKNISQLNQGEEMPPAVVTLFGSLNIGSKIINFNSN